MRYACRGELAAKIDNEGGLASALYYGIRSGDMPEGDNELRREWEHLEEAFDQFAEIADYVRAMLPDSWSRDPHCAECAYG